MGLKEAAEALDVKSLDENRMLLKIIKLKNNNLCKLLKHTNI